MSKSQVITIKQYSILPFIYQWVIFFSSVVYGWTSISQMIIHSRIELFSIAKLCGLLVLTFFGFTTCYQIDFNPVRKTFRRYVYFAGLKFGELYRFESIEKIFINRNKYFRPERTGPVYRKDIKMIYTAYLKFDSGEKIKLMESSRKNPLIAEITDYNKHLKTSIYDNTSGTAILIK
jgi:hypothetical protein